MTNFWDFKVWGVIDVIAVLLLALIVANVMKKYFKVLRRSMIPTSVLGGFILLAISVIFKAVTGTSLFDSGAFGYDAALSVDQLSGTDYLDMLTYHSLALGFIAMTFKSSKNKMSKQRTKEIFNTGVTTVSTYLLQGILGLAITIGFATLIASLIPAAGILLPFGYGQGTGQALNYGSIYESDYNFIGGRNFGLSIAALGFLSASIGGVIHMNVMRAKGKLVIREGKPEERVITPEERANEEGKFMNGGIETITMQIAAIFITYFITYGIIYLLGMLIPSFRSVLYGFNFLIGVLVAILVKFVLSKLRGTPLAKYDYIDSDLMDKIGSFFYDLMIVAGIAAINISLLADYWYVVIILGLVGAFSTYAYNRYVAHKLFADYEQEQFLVMYGMLTGTASTGVILLREIDRGFKTPAADNLVYQNFPAMVFGFPMMLLAALAPKQPLLTLGILVGFFLVMNIILFRNQIFKFKKGQK